MKQNLMSLRYKLTEHLFEKCRNSLDTPVQGSAEHIAYTCLVFLEKELSKLNQEEPTSSSNTNMLAELVSMLESAPGMIRQLIDERNALSKALDKK